MAKFIPQSWQCICGKIERDKPWACPGCGKEVCENCFDKFMHCKECSQQDDSLLKKAAADMYAVEFI